MYNAEEFKIKEFTLDGEVTCPICKGEFKPTSQKEVFYKGKVICWECTFFQAPEEIRTDIDKADGRITSGNEYYEYNPKEVERYHHYMSHVLK